MRYFLCIFLLAFGLSSRAQVLHPKGLPDYELELASMGDKVITSKTEEDRIKVNGEFKDLLMEALQIEKSIEYPFESVKNLSKQIVIPGKLRLFTWVVPLKDGTYQYFGFVMIIDRKNEIKVNPLEDRSSEMASPAYDWLKPSKWYGAIYYDVIEVKGKGKKYYTLLGYRPGDKKVQEKLIDVITYDGKNVRFGAKIFETPKISDYQYKQRPYRLLFPYSNKVTASIKWHEDLEKIVMDHLSPPDASLKGKWEFYGPDFSYDAFFWKKGKWHLEEMVEFNTELKTVTPKEKPKQGLGEK